MRVVRMRLGDEHIELMQLIILVLARRFRNQICAAHARQLQVEGMYVGG
jgi:hypothetical protein